MDKTIGRQLEETFREASQSYIRKLLETDRDRAAFDAIRNETSRRHEEAVRLYEAEYKTRVAVATQALYDGAAQLDLDHPAPPGVVSDADQAITRQAERMVRLAHEGDIQALFDDAQHAFEDLLAEAELRGRGRNLARQAFGGAGERRSGQDRRQKRNQSIE